MPITHKKLGLYWGIDGISLVEVYRGDPVKAAYISFADLEATAPEGLLNITEDPRLLDLVQRAVRNQGFSTVDTAVSLPSKDIILRWFVIPWMKPHEVQGAVSFEAQKYLPFSMDELIYTYYPATFLKDGVRNIGVVFVAIRKDVYQRYINVLVQSGLNVICGEPASMSLLRALISRRFILPEQSLALLKLGRVSGEIFIVADGHVRFIRDFRLAHSDGPVLEEGEDVIRARLFNEVKMSLDFFSRQQMGVGIRKVLVFGSDLDRAVLDGFSEEMGLSLQKVDQTALFDKFTSVDFGHVNAYGAALSGDVSSVIDFNLNEGRPSEAAVVSGPKKIIWGRKKLTAIATVVAFCALLLGLTWFLFGQIVLKKQAELVKISNDLGEFSTLQLDDLSARKKEENNKLRILKSISFRSSLTPLAVRLVQLIPEGLWLDDLSIVAPEVAVSEQRGAVSALEIKPVLSFSGLAFAGDDANEAFNLVNQFVETLQQDKDFSSHFGNVRLISLSAQTFGKKEVAKFSIKCE